MALPDLAACKRVVKQDTTAEDTLIGELLARAKGVVQGIIQTPLESTSMVFTDWAETNVARSLGPRSLLVPKTPFDPETLAINDSNDAAIDLADLIVSGLTGIVRYRDGSAFAGGPYTLTADVGIDTHPDYADILEPILSSAILDVVVDLYARRNPSTQSEGVAAGENRSYAAPDRIRQNLAPVVQAL
jgi:hypothetical protein